MDTPDITQAFRDAAKGLDFYWPGTSINEACERYGLAPEQVIKMASNENAYGPSPKAIAAARDALEKAAIYPSAKYDYAGLKRALADYAGVDANMIVPGPGSESVARYIAHLFISPGDEVVVALQSYDGHAWVSRLMGGVVRSVPLVAYRYDIDAVLAAVNERTRIIWICNPINPTGTVLSRSEARRLVESVSPTTAVVFDQAYREFADDPDYGDGRELLLDGFRNVIVLRTLSKMFGIAAIRLGYGIAAPGDLHDHRQHLRTVPHQRPSLRGRRCGGDSRIGCGRRRSATSSSANGGASSRGCRTWACASSRAKATSSSSTPAQTPSTSTNGS